MANSLEETVEERTADLQLKAETAQTILKMEKKSSYTTYSGFSSYCRYCRDDNWYKKGSWYFGGSSSK